VELRIFPETNTQILNEYVYGTDRHKHALFARGYWQLLRVRVYTDARFRPYDDECDKTVRTELACDKILVCKNRTGGKK
jgi:hypothetical protein